MRTSPRRVHIDNVGVVKWLNHIISGQKTVEGRLAAKIKDWNLFPCKQFILYGLDDRGDELEALVEVVDLHIEKDFESLYDRFGDRLVPIPDMNRDKIKSIYDYYSQEDVERYGVVGIEIKYIGLWCD